MCMIIDGMTDYLDGCIKKNLWAGEGKVKRPFRRLYFRAAARGSGKPATGGQAGTERLPKRTSGACPLGED